LLQQAFDRYAGEYDQHFTHSRIGRAQRARVHRQLDKVLKKTGRGHILEVNCGTGEDAAYLSAKGYVVTASDISQEMIRVASEKPGNRNVRFICAPMQDLGSHLGTQTYDGLFSNFGGLNCLAPEEIKQFSHQAFRWLAPDASFVAVVMGRRCVWERTFFTWRKEPGKAGRRLQQAGVLTRIGDQEFKTWYYSPRELATLIGEGFELARTRPIGLFVPPSYLEPWIARHPFFFRVLLSFERFFGAFGLFADYADHYLIVLKKKAS